MIRSSEILFSYFYSLDEPVTATVHIGTWQPFCYYLKAVLHGDMYDVKLPRPNLRTLYGRKIDNIFTSFFTHNGKYFLYGFTTSIAELVYIRIKSNVTIWT